MVIREDRDKLISMVNEYLHDNITAFEFDDKLWTLNNSQDATVVHLRLELWYYYDDCKDHKIVASKELWDYFQRILLLLHTDAEIKITKRRHWHYTQWFAMILFAVAVCIYIFSVNWVLAVIIHAVLWLFSYLIFKSQSSDEIRRREGIPWNFCYPYKNIQQLLTFRRKTPSFKKEPFPQKLNRRTIRPRILELKCEILTFIAWVCFCPLVLLYQAIPSMLVQSILFVENEKGNGCNGY